MSNVTPGDIGGIGTSPLTKFKGVTTIKEDNQLITTIPTADSSNEFVQYWLHSFENGRFAVPALENATGADLYRLEKDDFVNLLGPLLGPSLYAVIHKSKLFFSLSFCS